MCTLYEDCVPVAILLHFFLFCTAQSISELQTCHDIMFVCAKLLCLVKVTVPFVFSVEIISWL